MSETIQVQVLALTKLKPKAEETADDFTRRAVKKLHGLTDEQWAELPDSVQAWTNDNMLADEKELPLVDPLELPEAEAADPEPTTDKEVDPVEEETAEDAAEQKEPVVAKSVKSTSKKVAAAKPEKKAASKAAAKPAKVAKEGGETRGRKPNIGPLNAKIKILNKKPPGRADTVRQKVFAKYQSGMTVEAAHKAGVPYNFMRWHVAQGWIELN